MKHRILCGFQLFHKSRNEYKGIIGSVLHFQCLDRQVSSVAAFFNDVHQSVNVHPNCACIAKCACLYLPVCRVGNDRFNIRVRILYLEVSGVEDNTRPSGINCLVNFDALFGCLQHVAVVLNSDHHPVLFSKCRTFLETFDHPTCNFVPFVFIACRDCTGKQADNRRSQFGGQR